MLKGGCTLAQPKRGRLPFLLYKGHMYYTKLGLGCVGVEVCVFLEVHNFPQSLSCNCCCPDILSREHNLPDVPHHWTNTPSTPRWLPNIAEKLAFATFLGNAVDINGLEAWYQWWQPLALPLTNLISRPTSRGDVELVP